MRKRLAVFAALAVTALGVSASASASMHKAPAGSGCAAYDLTCKA
jgi:hypothetical protein